MRFAHLARTGQLSIASVDWVSTFFFFGIILVVIFIILNNEKMAIILAVVGIINAVVAGTPQVASLVAFTVLLCLSAWRICNAWEMIAGAGSVLVTSALYYFGSRLISPDTEISARKFLEFYDSALPITVTCLLVVSQAYTSLRYPRINEDER
jgi:hypothetical protein